MAHRLCLDGLKPDARYRELASGKEYYGDTLMRAGILLPLQQADFTAQFYHFAMVYNSCKNHKFTPNQKAPSKLDGALICV